MARVTFSPTTDPMLPPRNSKAITRAPFPAVDFAQTGDDRFIQAGFLDVRVDLVLVLGKIERVKALQIRRETHETGRRPAVNLCVPTA